MRWHIVLLAAAMAYAGDFPRTLEAFPGTTPTIDGVVSPGEYVDATAFAGVTGWMPQFTPTTSNFGNFHHEDWRAGEKNIRTQLRQFGTLWLRAKNR